MFGPSAPLPSWGASSTACPFQIQPLREFLVRPALPPSLNRLAELAYNLLWSWDHTIRSVFRRLDPILWKTSNHNPIQLLGRITQERLDQAAADPRFLVLYRRACERHDSYVQAPALAESVPRIAYFSMEYGLLDCLQIYSGGLGILSGDHLKAASDGDFALTGVGLLYQRGYLQQYLNPDGWQQERTPVNDFYTLPVRPCEDEQGKEVIVSLRTADRRAVCQGLAYRCGTRDAVSAGYQHSAEQGPPSTARLRISYMAGIFTSASGRRSF